MPDASPVRTLVPAALAIVGFNALHGLFTYVRGKWAAEASEGIVRRLRHELYWHLERLPSAYHDRADTGDLVQRCSSDVETVRVFLAAQVVEIARVAFFLAIATPIMLSQDLRMSAVSLAVMPVLLVFAVLFFRQVRRLFELVDASDGRLTTLLQENLTGIRVVRAFGQQQFEIGRFHERNGELRDLEYRLFIALQQLLDALRRVGLAADRTGARSAAAISFCKARFRSAPGSSSRGWCGRSSGRCGRSAACWSIRARPRSRSIGFEPFWPSRVESVEPLPDRPIGGDIEIRDLTFRYHDGPPVLDNLSLSIRSGEVVALLGPPGPGKSTLVNLLVRLYDYEQGSIKIGGQELKADQSRCGAKRVRNGAARSVFVLAHRPRERGDRPQLGGRS